MNLQTQINEKLWATVQKTYTSGNFTHSTLDAMHYLSNLLREKSNLDGDGVALVGQALGGPSPPLRINKLQTETEKNEQKGIEQLLRGMYQFIRNPRSHDQMIDKQETADAIILFINYLISVIERSEESFVVTKFLARVFDDDFYRSDKYAELLVNEVPENKRFDTLISLYREKLNGDIYNISLVVRTFLDKMPESLLEQFFVIVSEELKEVANETELKYNLHLLPPGSWSKLSEISRLRSENRVIRAIEEGYYYNGKCKKGALATWARQHFDSFILKDRVGAHLFKKLSSENRYEYQYFAMWFFSNLPLMAKHNFQIDNCINKIAGIIRGNDKIMYKALTDNFYLLPSVWRDGFIDKLKDLTNEDNPAIYLEDGTPFLNASVFEFNDIEEYVDEDEIPF